MTQYYLIGLGSNIDPETNIVAAQKAIAEYVEIIELSPVLINPPCGKTFRFPFHNQIILIHSSSTDQHLKSIFETIELQQGREARCPERKFNDRPIDIDILHQHHNLDQLLKLPLEESYNQQIRSTWNLEEAKTSPRDSLPADSD